MKSFLIAIAFLAFGANYAQNDTIYTSAREMSDTIMGNFSELNCPTGRLLNRVFNRTDSTLIWLDKIDSEVMDTITSDHMYNLISENNFISFDSTNVHTPLSYFTMIKGHILEYGEDRNLIPLGIIDIEYNYFNFDSLMSNGDLTLNGPVVNLTSYSSSLDQSRLSIAGPVYDYVSGELLEFVLLDDFIISDDTSGIRFIELNFGNEWMRYSIGDTIKVFANESTEFVFQFKVVFNNKRVVENYCLVNTPDNPEFFQKSSKFECNEKNEIEGADGRKLKWCLLHGCVPDGDNYTWDKPFILVSGYRPPAVELKFKKLYKLYDSYHNDYLDQLRQNGFDVFLVKFNFDYKPYIMGTSDASNLFIEFLDMVNQRKTIDADGYNENVIQGNSMGADVVRLALIRMENQHWTTGRPHHHSRLFISDDANYYGANIPLSQQYLLESKMYHTPITGIVPWTFYLSSHFIMQAKLFRELVQYHYDPIGVLNFGNSNVQFGTIASNHWERTALENTLYGEYQGSKIVPVPDHTRNISVALGKIKEKNSDEFVNNNFIDDHFDYVENGNPFADVNFLTEKYYVRASVTGNYFQDLFWRKSFLGWFGVPFVFLRHRVKIKDMLAVDNSSGSFLDGHGNFGATAGEFIVAEGVLTFGPEEITMGAQLMGSKFTHKPVVSALAINPNLWPGDGSMTQDMHSLNLMYQHFNILQTDQSDHYGYPHLGNPTNHFDITPFEAIYVDNQVHAHIDFRGSYSPYVDSLNNFLLNEIEPWYLGLQNQNLGSQVQPNVLYKAERRAKYRIDIGENVTPITNQNPYVVEPNVDLKIHAGQEIHFQTGVHLKPGSKVHAYIEYTDCSYLPLQFAGTSGSGRKETEGRFLEEFAESNDHVSKSNPNENLVFDVQIFPNPSNNSYFNIQAENDFMIESLHIYNYLGGIVYSLNSIKKKTTKVTHSLETGVYLIEVISKGNRVIKKLIVE